LTARNMDYRLAKLESLLELPDPVPPPHVDLSWLTDDELNELAQHMRHGDTSAAEELWKRIQIARATNGVSP
jgi:hypothetical protein